MLPAIRSIRGTLRGVTPSFHHSEYQFSKVSGCQPFDFVRKLFTYERVARLSFPYPSSKLTAPQIPRPAPRAITSVCSTVTALLKNAILHSPFLKKIVSCCFRSDDLPRPNLPEKALSSCSYRTGFSTGKPFPGQSKSSLSDLQSLCRKQRA